MQIFFNSLERSHKLLADKTPDYIGLGVAVEWLDIDGPIFEQWPPLAQSRWFNSSDLGKESVEAEVVIKEKLSDFMAHAFRRPVTLQETARYHAISVAAMNRGKTPAEAMKQACKAVLVSPSFLFHADSIGQGIDEYEVASRLSYFLCRSLPDEKLRRLVEDGELQKPGVLRTEVDRLLDDPKSARLTTDLADLWFDLHRMNVVLPNETIYPEFDQTLGQSMREETNRFLREMIASNLPVSNLVQSDFVIVDSRLAEHYGILPEFRAAVADESAAMGDVFFRVPLSRGSQRGGLVTHGAVLLVTANGTATSPVTRGVWIMERLLGMTPEPPPPGIPALERDISGAATIREQLALHRDDATCASCHARIDPPGFALESFDPIGGWRERYRTTGKGEAVTLKLRGRNVAYRIGKPVDSSGETVDGEPFEDVVELRQILLKNPRQIARNVVNRLVAFSTGAEPTFADREEIEAILDRTEKDGFPMRTLIHQIVQSELFRLP